MNFPGAMLNLLWKDGTPCPDLINWRWREGQHDVIDVEKKHQLRCAPGNATDDIATRKF